MGHVWSRYRQSRNILKNTITEKYNQYLVRKSSELVNNRKRAWNLIQSNNKSKRIPNVMQLDSTVATTPFQIADLFNSYFYSTFKKCPDGLEKPVIDKRFNRFLNDLAFTPDDVFFVLKISIQIKLVARIIFMASFLKNVLLNLLPLSLESLITHFNQVDFLCPGNWPT